MARTFSLAVVPGDGIGPEVTAQALSVLDVVAPRHEVVFERAEYDLGARRWHATGETLPQSALDEIRGHDAILLGAIGDPSVPSGVLERGLLLKLRFELDHYVNLRPSKLFPGVATPLASSVTDRGEIDFLVVREGTEGPYVGNGGAIRVGTPHEVATEVSLNTAFGVERVVRDAFARAQARPRKKLTLVHKNNVLVHAGHLWSRTVDAVAKEFPDIAVDYLHVDAATIFLATNPSRFDVIVTDNLFGDILTDLAAAEPVHGSAPDIAGQAKADPTAAILSTALLLDHLGLPEAAAEITAAVEADIAERGASVRSTPEIGEAIAKRL